MQFPNTMTAEKSATFITSSFLEMKILSSYLKKKKNSIKTIQTRVLPSSEDKTESDLWVKNEFVGVGGWPITFPLSLPRNANWGSAIIWTDIMIVI